MLSVLIIDCFLPVPIQMLRSVIGIIRRRRINEVGVSKTINRLNIQIIFIYAYNIFIEIELNQIKSNQIKSIISNLYFAASKHFFLPTSSNAETKLTAVKFRTISTTSVVLITRRRTTIQASF